jgi:hypothetical protein
MYSTISAKSAVPSGDLRIFIRRRRFAPSGGALLRARQFVAIEGSELLLDLLPEPIIMVERGCNQFLHPDLCISARSATASRPRRRICRGGDERTGITEE